MIRALRSLHAATTQFYREFGFDPWDNYRFREESVCHILSENGWDAQRSPGRHGSDFVTPQYRHGEIKTRLASPSPTFQWSRLRNPSARQTLQETDCMVFAVFSRLEFRPQSVWVITDAGALHDLKALVLSRVPPEDAPRDTVSLTLREVLAFPNVKLDTAETHHM